MGTESTENEVTGLIRLCQNIVCNTDRSIRLSILFVRACVCVCVCGTCLGGLPLTKYHEKERDCHVPFPIINIIIIIIIGDEMKQFSRFAAHERS